MAQLFGPSSNIYAKLSILLALAVPAAGVGMVWIYERTPYKTNEGKVYEQPIKFSHDHHTAGLGIDCRYCHHTVERAATATIPATEVCMNCHSQVWADSPMLEGVRASYRDNKPIQWNRVYDLPDYVYFDHSIHVSKGVACFTCHGEVDKMPLLKRATSLQMQWCLDCHRDPTKNLRPADKVTDFRWQPDKDFDYIKQAHSVDLAGQERLWSCSTCHR
jgi:Cytochrome c7 and related cytochrome c/Class III cytochrome C family